MEQGDHDPIRPSLNNDNDHNVDNDHNDGNDDHSYEYDDLNDNNV